jgi:hypothetical protein
MDRIPAVLQMARAAAGSEPRHCEAAARSPAEGACEQTLIAGHASESYAVEQKSVPLFHPRRLSVKVATEVLPRALAARATLSRMGPIRPFSSSSRCDRGSSVPRSCTLVLEVHRVRLVRAPRAFRECLRTSGGLPSGTRPFRDLLTAS